MLDIKLFREKAEEVKEKLAKRQIDAKIVDEILEIDEKKRELITKLDNLRAEQKREKKKTKESILRKKEIKNLEESLEKVKNEFEKLMLSLPNLPLDSVPLGKDETENKIIKTYGEKPEFDFKPKPHWELAKKLDLIDQERSAKVSGSRFFYLKKDLVILEFALIQFVLEKLINKGFIPMIPPYLVKERAMYGTSFFPGAEASEIYKVNPGEDDLYLIGTSEVSLINYHDNEILEEKNLPIHYLGFSPCFRREAGAYGKETKGIIRVHQFEKLEMVSFCKPEDSEKEHQLILSLEEEIMQDLGFHYQVVEMCTGALGYPAAAKKFDIEVWLPGEGRYLELTSCSNCTDFQARRLNIRYRKTPSKEEPKPKLNLVHTLNGTACAISRTLVAILENYQQKDGSIIVPEILRPYTVNIERIK